MLLRYLIALMTFTYLAQLTVPRGQILLRGGKIRLRQPRGWFVRIRLDTLCLRLLRLWTSLPIRWRDELGPNAAKMCIWLFEAFIVVNRFIQTIFHS